MEEKRGTTTYTEENDSMGEGRQGLPLHERIKAAIEESQKDKEGNVVEKPIVQIGGTNIELDIRKHERESSYKIHILGVHILSLDEKNELSFVEGWEPALREQIKNNPDIINAKDLIEDLRQMELALAKEKEAQQKKEAKGEAIGPNEKDEEDLSKEKEQEEPEKEETGDKTKEIAKKYNVNSSRVTHVSLTRQVAGRETLPELDNKTKGYKDVYVIPGKDAYSRIMIGIDKDGKEEEIKNDRSRGRIPDINIKLIEKNKITDKIRPYDYWPINNKEGMAIIRDSAGKDTLIYCRQEEGRGKEFQGVIVPEKDKKNIDSNPKEVRDAMDYRQNSAKDLADRAELFEQQKEYEEKLGAPSVGGQGVQLEEIENARVQKERNIKAYKEDLMQRDGVSLSEALKRNAIPGYYEKVNADYQRKAEQVYKLVTEDKISYEDAVRRVKANDREQGGNTPDQNLRKRNQ